MIVVNLLAGPGAGKSTLMSELNARLKRRGLVSEMAPEFAKELLWQGRFKAMGCQPYVFGEQLWRTESLRGTDVQVVITDSPLLLSAVYGIHRAPEAFLKAVRVIAQSQPRINFFLERPAEYDARGRRQSLESAKGVDRAILETLEAWKEPCLKIPAGRDGAAALVEHEILKRLDNAP